MIDLAGGSTSTTGVKFLTRQNTRGIQPFLVQVYRNSLESLAGSPILPEYADLFSSAKAAHTKTGFATFESAYLYLIQFVEKVTGKQAYSSTVFNAEKQVTFADLSYGPTTVTTTITTRNPEQQRRFKQNVSLNCNGRCVVTGSNIAIHAAHLEDLRHGGDYNTDNGLLLDATLHHMFDHGFMAINPQTLTIHFAENVDHPYVKLYQGKKLAETIININPENLQRKWKNFFNNACTN